MCHFSAKRFNLICADSEKKMGLNYEFQGKDIT